MTAQRGDYALFEALSRFIANHRDAHVARFSEALADWGHSWQAVAPARLPVADLLTAALAHCDADARDLLQLFLAHNHRLRWEQSYRRQDGLVPDAMLDGYGFAEIVGLRGPLVSDRIRAGIAIWGPHIDYPRHQHTAEEAYLLLSGSLEFQFADSAAMVCHAGDVVLVESNRAHGFRTLQQTLVLCYLWQAGDLRETSRFAG